jgi:hypothetical protein
LGTIRSKLGLRSGTLGSAGIRFHQLTQLKLADASVHKRINKWKAIRQKACKDWLAEPLTFAVAQILPVFFPPAQLSIKNKIKNIFPIESLRSIRCFFVYLCGISADIDSESSVLFSED